MRSLFLTATLVLAPVLRAQPVDPLPFIPPPKPSIGHLHTRSGVPSAPLYHLGDTMLVTLIGQVKRDGSGGSRTPLYGFQRKQSPR